MEEEEENYPNDEGVEGTGYVRSGGGSNSHHVPHHTHTSSHHYNHPSASHSSSLGGDRGGGKNNAAGGTGTVGNEATGVGTRKYKRSKKRLNNAKEGNSKSSTNATATALPKDAAAHDLDKDKDTNAFGGSGGDGSNSAATGGSSNNRAIKKPRNKVRSRQGNSGNTGTSGNNAGNSSSLQNSNNTNSGGDRDRSDRANNNSNKSNNNDSSEVAAAEAARAERLQQQAVNDQMRRALEEDQYSANGSIVDTDTDEEEPNMYRGQPVRLDRPALLQAVRRYAASCLTKSQTQQHLKLHHNVHSAAGTAVNVSNGSDVDARSSNVNNKRDGLMVRVGPGNIVPLQRDRALSPSAVQSFVGGTVKELVGPSAAIPGGTDSAGSIIAAVGGSADLDDTVYASTDLDGGSIFGQTTGSSNSTWVECDKCKKWRRLRGVVDEKKLPSKWYCYMNKNDPERARCSAPEEAYETAHTPESAADARTRKHLRVWVRRLQCNEAYEARQPTLTRGKKRAASSSSKEPYEWVRCCNPSCGKWRAILRIMDAKSNVIDRTNDGEWYCVMNTWDEKAASCAAPQENLPAVGCPPWVMQDET